MLSAFLFIIATSSVWANTALATSTPIDESRALSALIETYKELPQNKAELIEQVRSDFSEASRPYLDDLIRASSYKDVEVFVAALENTEDPVVLARLAERLQDQGGTYIRFLALVQARIRQDPAKLEHMKNLADQLLSHLKNKKLKKIAIAQRSTNAFMTVGA